MVQGNNQMFGSPVNRVKITGYAAADSLPRLQGLSAGERVRESFHRGVFYTVMFSIDAAFWAVRFKNWLLSWRSQRVGQQTRGFEDELEQQMAEVMKSEYGVEVDPAMFNA
jgi:aarF domain-containing kinase